MVTILKNLVHYFGLAHRQLAVANAYVEIAHPEDSAVSLKEASMFMLPLNIVRRREMPNNITKGAI